MKGPLQKFFVFLNFRQIKQGLIKRIVVPNPYF